jgi:hypothetical protein
LATAVTRGYNAGYQELVSNIQTTLGIPQILDKLDDSTTSIRSISNKVTSLISDNQKNRVAIKNISARLNITPPVYDTDSLVGGVSSGTIPDYGKSKPRNASSNGVVYTVSNNITVNTDERSGKAVENAASYVFLRGTLNPKL